ncbi:probable esterase PIR7A [Abrus precatorius]|uniref:Probable esterase PIR7A n=1 Tax=Abrus precatorius TaxID=3816 RepID=A0A8B8K126_ABRPR|nr:probable esterase PIR7A [Abrus precatorius]
MCKRETHVVLIVLFFLSFSACVNGKHFVLVHGAGHGAWCWYKVATMLKSGGHNVTTLDLVASGINPKQVQDIDSISQYYEPLMTFMGSIPPKEKVILVGHSLGGISISVAMERFHEKISLAIFVTAFVTSQNLTYPAILREAKRLGIFTGAKLLPLDAPNKTVTVAVSDPEMLRSRLYQLSPPQDLTLALSLVRPSPFFNDNDELLLKETTVTKNKNGRVSKVFIISTGDNLITKDFQLWMIERTGPFAEVKEIKGSDHMVMFSKPEKLTSQLLDFANKNEQCPYVSHKFNLDFVQE